MNQACKVILAVALLVWSVALYARMLRERFEALEARVGILESCE